MGNLVLIHSPPRKRLWKIEIDGRKFETEDEIISQIRMVLKGNAWYMKTQFRDPKTRTGWCAPSRQKHFADGYWVYTVWFDKKNDAALFKLICY